MDYKPLLKSRLFLVAVDEEQYPDKIVDLLRVVTNAHKRICYVCLNKPYADVMEDIKRINLDINKFFFIDILTGHYKKPENNENCIFIESPPDIIRIGEAIQKAVTEKGCDEIFIDTVSSLLIYNQGFHIIKLVHSIKNGDISKLKGLKQSVLISLRGYEMLEDDYESLFKDLSMFADKVISSDQDGNANKPKRKVNK